ncbi:MAG TPA: hypothetical protein VJN67_12485 [Stellaceae bacterium]|nr:hypothetical protein [Stellaceae bacterium]
MADNLANAVARDSLIEMAERYDRLADQMEKRAAHGMKALPANSRQF